jgi:anti-anti-sigma regulatory factor
MSAALTSNADVVADLRDLHFADSSVMVDLALLAGRLRAGGRTLRLRGPQPHVEALINMVGLARLPAVSLTES